MSKPTRAERQRELAAQMVPPTPPDPAPENREPTARERLADLDARRRVDNGYIVPPPSLGTKEDVRAWLRAVSEVGNSGDVEIAWHHIQNIHIKNQLRNEYEALCSAAGKRHNVLIEAAMAEERIEGAKHAEHARKAKLQSDLAAAEARVAELKRQLAG